MFVFHLTQQLRPRRRRRRLCGLLAGVFSLLCTPGLAQNDQDLLGEPRQYLTWRTVTLREVAQHHQLDIGELRRANPELDGEVLPGGTLLSLPSGRLLPNVARDGIVVNLAESRLYVFGDRPDTALSFPITVADRNCGAAIGPAEVSDLRVRPAWTVPAAWHALDPKLPETILPGPANPLGAFAIDLNWQGYVIHEANGPHRALSDKGCIGLAYQDISRIFGKLTLGTRVNVIDQPIKLGWSAGALYLEVHPPRSAANSPGPLETVPEVTPEMLELAVKEQAWGREGDLDWQLILEAAREQKGIPVRITRPSS